jgi:hypothetical protein
LLPAARFGQHPFETLICPALFVLGVPGGALATGPPPAMTPHVPAYAAGIG